MSSLAAARADNFYHGPDYDPAKHGSLNKYRGSHGALGARANKMDQGILIIRFEVPFHLWCAKCGEKIAKGERFNAEKKAIGAYHSTKIWEFRMSHHCGSCIIITTDPKNAQYCVVEGARQKVESYTAEDAGVMELRDAAEREQLRNDPLYRLEHGEKAQQQARTAAQQIVELQQLSDDLHADPYAINKALRKQMRAARKEEQALQAKRDALHLPETLQLLPEEEGDAVEAAIAFLTADNRGNRGGSSRSRIMSQSIFSAPKNAMHQQKTKALPPGPAAGAGASAPKLSLPSAGLMPPPPPRAPAEAAARTKAGPATMVGLGASTSGAGAGAGVMVAGAAGAAGSLSDVMPLSDPRPRPSSSGGRSVSFMGSPTAGLLADDSERPTAGPAQGGSHDASPSSRADIGSGRDGDRVEVQGASGLARGGGPDVGNEREHGCGGDSPASTDEGRGGVDSDRSHQLGPSGLRRNADAAAHASERLAHSTAPNHSSIRSGEPSSAAAGSAQAGPARLEPGAGALAAAAARGIKWRPHNPAATQAAAGAQGRGQPQLQGQGRRQGQGVLSNAGARVEGSGAGLLGVVGGKRSVSERAQLLAKRQRLEGVKLMLGNKQ